MVIYLYLICVTLKLRVKIKKLPRHKFIEYLNYYVIILENMKRPQDSDIFGTRSTGYAPRIVN